MSVTLQQALDAHQITDLSKISTSNWTYLSYDPTSGWDIVKFEGICGFFQQFFRWLGCYGSTHLKTVALAIVHEPNVSALLAKVQASWQKAYPTEAFPTATTSQPQEAPAVSAAFPAAPSQTQEMPAVSAPEPVEIASIRIKGTRISVEVGDITKLRNLGAIVNPANLQLVPGEGVSRAIYEAAGKDLFDKLQKGPYMHCVNPGEACITGSGNLDPGIKRIIHAVPPDGKKDSQNWEEILGSIYKKCLDLAKAQECESVAFPSLGTGRPFDRATRAAIQAIRDYVEENKRLYSFDQIRLIFWDPKQPELGEQAKKILLEKIDE